MASRRRSNSGGGVGVVLVLVLILWLASHGKLGSVGRALGSLTSLFDIFGSGSQTCQSLEHAWDNAGGDPTQAVTAASVAMAESGGDASAVQSGQPPGKTGWGAWQITPTSGITQYGQFGNLLNLSNNARAAVYVYNQNGWGAWTTYNDGAYSGRC